MGVNTRDNGNITVEQNQPYLEEGIKVINKIKITPMNPTPLYVFLFFFSHLS